MPPTLTGRVALLHAMRPKPTPKDARRPWHRQPLRRAYAELYCLLLTVVFHDGNNHGRKALTILLVVAWAAIEVGAAYGLATLPDQFFVLRLVVGLVIGRMWGIEMNNLAGVEFSYSDAEDDSNDD